ncbi:formin-like protein 20 [Aquila chrysaetos chrysaetos]|uniref:formin-like protein 20 n=1 Tax=Aquila chrysaetos chrysaetos TaxID=223781 RepID=UPI001176CBF1|nr:formin-like protein 20 [Aquila chrysaetos chrysaetos]
MLCGVRSHRDQVSRRWISNQRQPDKNAPSVDNGPAFLLASLLFFLADRKKVSSPPPPPRRRHFSPLLPPPPTRRRLLRKSRHGAAGPRSAPPGPGTGPTPTREPGEGDTHTHKSPPSRGPRFPQPPCRRDGRFLPCRRGLPPVALGCKGLGGGGSDAGGGKGGAGRTALGRPQPRLRARGGPAGLGPELCRPQPRRSSAPGRLPAPGLASSVAKNRVPRREGLLLCTGSDGAGQGRPRAP